MRTWVRPRNARMVRVAAPLLLLTVVLAVGVWRWPRHAGGHQVNMSPVHYAGTITLATPGGWAPPSWNVTYSNYAGNLWDYLLDYKPDGSFFPELAAQVPSLANGSLRVVNGNEVITYHLKPNLRWSNGTAITGADYIAALVLASAPEVQLFGPQSSPCALYAARISGATLVVTLNGIFAEALETCNFMPVPWEYLQRKYHLPIPADLTAAFDAERVAAMYAAGGYQGSPLQRMIARINNDPYTSPGDLFNGPYRMASWSPAGAGVEQPNRYFTALPPDPQHPRPAQIRLVTVPGDVATGTRALAGGALPPGTDLAFVISGTLPAMTPPLPLQAHAPFRLLLAPRASPDFLELNQGTPALRDKRVRQALLYAIDKIAYLRQTFRISAAQAAAIADTAPFGHLMRFSIANQLPANLYNPAKARALLAAAGYATAPTEPGRHLHLDLYTSTRPGRERGDVILQRMWRQVGIDVTLHFSNDNGSGGLLSSYGNGGILARGAFAIAEYADLTSRDAGFAYYAALDPGQIPDQNHPDGLNFARVRDRTLFALLTQAEHTLDDATRQQLYARFQRAMVDQAYWIPLYDLPDLIWVKPTIGNFNPNGGYAGDGDFFWNSYEWYVK